MSQAQAASSSKVLLRVKRLKYEDPVLLLQFSGKKRARKANVKDISDQLSSTSLKNDDSTSLIWKRMDDSQRVLESSNLFDSKSCSIKTKRSLFIDATLGPTDAKRRRLTLQQSSPFTSNQKRPKGIILDPLSRLVDENLKKVLEGSATLQNYLDFLEQDTRVSHEVKRYIGRRLDDGSNVLHIAALWNCVEQARHILLNYGKHVNIDEMDASGHRPYQIAKLAGHNQMADIIEAFGADTHDYAYDIFYLATDSRTEEAEEATMVELEGSFGCFMNEGKLIFDHFADDTDDSSTVAYGDDDDSNAEDHENNDYPEEEELDEGGSQSDDSSNDAWNINFRNQTTSLGECGSKETGYPAEEDFDYNDQIDLYSNDEDIPCRYAYDPNYND